MKKLIATSIVIISVMLLSAYGALFLVDYKNSYQQFAAKNNANFLLKAESIEVLRSPFPALKIRNIQDDNIQIDEIELSFSLISLLKFNPVVQSCKIKNVKISVSSSAASLKNHDQLVVQFMKYLPLANSLQDVRVKNLSLTTSSHTNSEQFSSLTAKDIYSGQIDENSIQIRGLALNFGSFIATFTAAKDGANIFHFTIQDEEQEFRLQEQYKDEKLVSGKGNYIIKDFSVLLSNANLGELFGSDKIATDDPVIASFEIVNNDDFLLLNNLQINTAAGLKNPNQKDSEISGSGEIRISKTTDSDNKVSLYFTKLGLKSLLTRSSKVIGKSTANFLPRLLVDQNSDFDIATEQIILPSTDLLSKLKFVANFEQGKLQIKNFSAQIGSKGTIELVGEVTNNGYRSIFNGRVYLVHQDVNQLLNLWSYNKLVSQEQGQVSFTADLKATPIDLYLQNLSLKTGGDEISGNFAVKFIGNLPRITSNLTFSGLDLSNPKYPVISPLISFARSLFQDMKADSYLSKFIDLRTLNYLANLDISVNNLAWQNLNLGKADLAISIAPGRVNISNLQIQSGNDYISSNISVNSAEVKPKINVEVKDGVIHTSLMNPSNILLLRNMLINEASLDKIFLTLNGSLSQLYQNDLLFENIKFSINNDNILFNIPLIAADLLSGKLKTQGSILLEPFTFNFVYALNSFDLQELSKALPNGVLDTEGVASINGMFTTSGASLEKLLYNLYSQSSFVAKDMKLNDLSMDKFLQNINSKDYNIVNLDTDLKKSLLTGSTKVKNLNSDLLLTNGVLQLQNVKAQTEVANCSADSGSLNIYDFMVKLTLKCNFDFLDFSGASTQPNKRPASMGIDWQGNIFGPQKTANIDELRKLIQQYRVDRSR